MNEFTDLLEHLKERGFDPSVLIDYLQRELAPAMTPDEENMIDPNTNQPYDYYDFGSYS